MSISALTLAFGGHAGKAGKQPTAEDEKQRRRKAQLLKEQKSLLR